jgi:hypothetical protein
VLRLFGFLLGATAAAGGMYYYVIDEYRIANELLTEDIYVRAPVQARLGPRILPCLAANSEQALQAAVQRIEGYVKTLETKIDSKRK